MLYGLVINTQRGMYTVKTEEEVLYCRLRGKLFYQQQKEKTLVVVGDQVFVEKLHGDQGIIVEIKERKSRLSRRGAGSRGRHLEQVIAANIDQAIIVAAVLRPQYKRNLLDRYMAAAEEGNIEPILCFNKIDLQPDQEYLEDAAYYRRHGYQVICTSTVTGEGMDDLQKALQDKLTVFTGSSGVGKSSLVNAMQEVQVAKTSHVGMTTRKGRHTTTSAHIYDLPFGGMIVDTPGMREFGLFHAEDGIRELFSDIEELALKCKFNDCTHTHEPGCAVKEAIHTGELEEERYDSYIKLAHSRF